MPRTVSLKGRGIPVIRAGTFCYLEEKQIVHITCFPYLATLLVSFSHFCSAWFSLLAFQLNNYSQHFRKVVNKTGRLLISLVPVCLSPSLFLESSWPELSSATGKVALLFSFCTVFRLPFPGVCTPFLSHTLIDRHQIEWRASQQWLAGI